MFFSQNFISNIEELIEINQSIEINKQSLYIDSLLKSEDIKKNIKDYVKISLLNRYNITKIRKTSSTITLDQILIHSRKNKIGIPFHITSGQFGYIYISGLGYIETYHREKLFTLIIKEYTTDNFIYQLMLEGEDVESNFIPSLFLGNTKIEICQFRVPYSDMFFFEYSNKYDFRSVVNYHLSNIQKAFSIIGRVIPYYYSWFVSVMEMIQVYNIPEVISFASINAYGCPFISASKDRSEIFFLEDLIHQGAHNIFYAVTYPFKDNLFTASFNTPVNHFTNSDDKRHIYGVFHGLFTQANINTCFDLCLDDNIYNGKLRHEIYGRLSDNMKRWKKAIQLFESYSILSREGMYFFNEFKNVYNRIYSKREVAILKYDTSNQPYIFDYKKFTKLNPYAL